MSNGQIHHTLVGSLADPPDHATPPPARACRELESPPRLGGPGRLPLELRLPRCRAAARAAAITAPPSPAEGPLVLRRATGTTAEAAREGEGGGAGPGRAVPCRAVPCPLCWRGRCSRRRPGLPVTAHFLRGWGRRGAVAAGSAPDGLGGRQAAMRVPGPAGRRPPP